MGAVIPLTSGQTHHLVNVVRIFKRRGKRRRSIDVLDDDGDDDGGRIRIYNGDDGEWLARVVRAASPTSSTTIMGKSGRRTPSRRRGGDEPSLVAQCVVRLREQDPVADDARPWVIFVPLKKQHRTKIMIEKCTEIGVGRMMPIASDRMEGESSIVSLVRPPRDDDDDEDGMDAARLDKLEVQSIEASEQCERLDVPIITHDAALTRSYVERSSTHGGLWTVRDFLSKWCREWEGGDVNLSDHDGSISTYGVGSRRVLLICRERGSGCDGVVPVLHALRENDRVAFLVGPEGGWSAEEERSFDEICSEYDVGRDGDSPVRCVSLGPSILRAETACMVAVSAWALTNDSR